MMRPIQFRPLLALMYVAAFAVLLTASPAHAAMPLIVPKSIYFPPDLPPLQVPLEEDTNTNPPLSHGPAILKVHVGDPFYAPLSTLLAPLMLEHQNDAEISPQESAELERYRRLREALLTELREMIAKLDFADRSTRTRGFETLAAKQTPHIVELEKLAEKLRAALARKVDWSALRQWRFNNDYEPTNKALRPYELMVVRGTIYYQDGLTPAQRRLLLEVAMDLNEQIHDPVSAEINARKNLYFQPETARIDWPSHVSPAIRISLNQLDETKQALKRELLAVVLRTDGDMLRARAFRQLTEEQAERIAAVEEFAQEIRLDLAGVSEFPRSSRPEPLPRAVIERIERFREADKALGQRTGESLQDAIAGGSQLPPRTEAAARRDWIADWKARLHNKGRMPSDDDLAAMLALIQELDAMRDQLQLVLGRKFPEVVGFQPDRFLALQEKNQKRALAFHEYDIAALEPGLSPEQRRLLLSGALETLDLPRPAAESQPTDLPFMR